MRAGTLDRQITIEALATVQDGFGDPVESWTALATVWAQMLPLRGTERFQAQQFDAELTTRFRIRYRDDVSELMRIVFDGDSYEIEAVIEVGRREGLELRARAHVPATGVA